MYPLVNSHIAIEHGPVEIVELPIRNGDFPYVAVYQRVHVSCPLVAELHGPLLQDWVSSRHDIRCHTHWLIR